jgi:uncharacterized protein DUF3455
MRIQFVGFAVLVTQLSVSSLSFANPIEAPEAVRPPADHKVALHTVGSGEITYECRAKAGATDVFEWAFVAPIATLTDLKQKQVGKYYAGPTWESTDGSKVTGKQVAVSPSTPGNIPLQLVKAEPTTGKGALSGITYIQRLNTKGGVAPADPCSAASAGTKKQVAYQADYVFYRM